MRETEKFFKQACMNGSVENRLQLRITDEGGTASSEIIISNEQIVSESMRLNQSICDDSNFKFGGCIASQFEIEISWGAYAEDLTGKYIQVILSQTAVMPTYPGRQTFPGRTYEVTAYPGFTVYKNSEFTLFYGKIYSCKLNKNQIIRKLIAYDDFYWKGSIDCTNWYRNLYKDESKIDTYGRITLGTIRRELLRKFKIPQVDEYLILPADEFPAYMIEENVTVGDLLRQICEFNGCFMFIKGEPFRGQGQVDYIFLSKQNDNDIEVYTVYIDVETEDFSKGAFDGTCIPGFTDGNGFYDFGGVSEHENLYFMKDNKVITTGYTTEGFALYYGDFQYDLKRNFNISYQPINLKSEYRSWVEIGDSILVEIKWYDLGGEKNTKLVYSFVLSRNLSGIQAITDEISADGENLKYTEDYFDSN